MLNLLFSIYLLLLLLRPQEWIESLRAVPILQVLLIACLVAWAFTGRRAWRLPQFPLLAWFLLATVMSALASGWLGGLVIQYQSLIPVLLMFLVLVSVAQELVVLRRLMKLMILCAGVMVLHGMWQKQTGVGWTGKQLAEGRITYAGIFDDPNDLGQLFVVCIAFCLYLLRDARNIGKLLLLLMVGWLCYGVFLTNSRGTLLAVVTVFALVALRRHGKVVLGVCAALALPVLVAYTRFGQISSSEESAAGRVDAWYAGYQMFRSDMAFGVGLGQFTEHNALTAHNSLVLPIAELGLFGFLPWFGVVLITGRMAYQLGTTQLRATRAAEGTGNGMISARAPAMSFVTPARSVAPPATVATVPAPSREVLDEQDAGYGLMLAASGFAVSCFFLSTSYKHMLFLVVGLVMARYAQAARLRPELPEFRLGGELPRVLVLGLIVVFGMWLVTKFLL